MTTPTKKDRKRLKDFRRGRHIKVRWINEYIRRGWIGRGETVYFPGGCCQQPFRLTEAGEQAIRDAKQNGGAK